MASWSEYCNQLDIQCWRDCYAEHGSSWSYWTCGAACQAAYMLCEAECAVNFVIDVVVDVATAAADFVRDNPGLVIGTIVVIGGIVLIATTGPAGAVVLVAA